MKIKIPPSESKWKITDLPAFLLESHPEKSEVREELLGRGQARPRFSQQRIQGRNVFGLTGV